MKIKAWVAVGPDGVPRAWTMSHLRRESIRLATESMMGYHEYARLLTTSDRWAHCYRRGCRVVPATVQVLR